MLEGNLWNILGMELNQNPTTLFVLFYSNITAVFKIKQLNKRKLIFQILSLFYFVLVFGKTKDNDFLI